MKRGDLTRLQSEQGFPSPDLEGGPGPGWTSTPSLCIRESVFRCQGPEPTPRRMQSCRGPGCAIPRRPSGLEAPLPHGACLWRHLSVVLKAQGGAGTTVAALLPKGGRMHPWFTDMRQAEVKQSSGWCPGKGGPFLDQTKRGIARAFGSLAPGFGDGL